MSEFAIVMPILVLLIMGMVLAGIYAFRAAASDWGVFVTGVGAGTFNTPADEIARKDVLWSDIRSRIIPDQMRLGVCNPPLPLMISASGFTD